MKSARAALSRAQRDTQEAFKRYKTCLDVEAQALQQVCNAEERRDALSTWSISSLVRIFVTELATVASLLDAYRTEGSEGMFRTSSLTLQSDDREASESSSRHSFAQEEPLHATLEQRPSPKQAHDQVANSL